MATKKSPSKKPAAKKVTKTDAKPKRTTVKKSADAKTKKTSTRKTSSKQKKANGKVLVCANGAKCFWTSDGKILKDLTELRDALKTMSEKVFAHHVTKEKNDFAEWVEYVLRDAACATALRKSRKPGSARTVIVRHLQYYDI